MKNRKILACLKNRDFQKPGGRRKKMRNCVLKTGRSRIFKIFRKIFKRGNGEVIEQTSINENMYIIIILFFEQLNAVII